MLRKESVDTYDDGPSHMASAGGHTDTWLVPAVIPTRHLIQRNVDRIKASAVGLAKGSHLYHQVKKL